MVRGDLDGGVWIGLEVVIPGGVFGETALGGDDDQVLAVPEVEQRRGALGAALRPLVIEQQHLAGDARDLVPEAPAGRPVERRVDAHEATSGRPDPIRYVEVAGRTPATCRLRAQVY